MEELFEDLKKYLIDNKIKFDAFVCPDEDYCVNLMNKTYELFCPNEEGTFFDSDFRWDCDKTEYDGYVYNFGSCWYYLNKGEEKNVKLHRLKWIGQVVFEEDFLKTECFLGVHGPCEMMNGTGSYSDWTKKAKFLGIQKLGICEKGSLSGLFKFQTACKRENIQPIFGMEVPIKDSQKDILFTTKIFVQNEKGWENILHLNKLINVEQNGFVSLEDLLQNREGLVVILDPKTFSFTDIPFKLKTQAKDFYYQLDTVIYEKEDRDEKYLKNLKDYVDSVFEPIAMCDAYYIEKEWSILRKSLNRSAGIVSHASENQYFKSNEEYFLELQKLFGKNDFDRLFDIFDTAVANLETVGNSCEYTIQTDVRHLPSYKMTKEESKIYKNNDEMFEDLVYQGLEDRLDMLDKYGDEFVAARIQEEIDIIKRGDLVDYFLILRDILNWTRSNGILSGRGRGSGAGSLVNYLLNITGVDPLQYHLLFSRFLNEGRLWKDEVVEMSIAKGENGESLEIDPKKKYTIFRNNKEMIIKGKDLKVGDKIEEI